MKLTFGCFKQLYRGYGIYFQGGHLNIEGDGEYRTMAECKARIDQNIAERESKEMADRLQRVAEGKAIRADRIGDTVTVHFPDGTKTVSIREYRNSIFEWEEKYDCDILVFHS